MIAAIALAAATIAAEDIAPPLDTPLLLVTEEVREDGRSKRRFRIERDIVFTTEPAGYRVTATMRRTEVDGAPAERRMFAAANATLIGLPIVLHLDRQGRLLMIEAVDTIWTAWTAGLRTMAGPAGARSAAARAGADRLADVPVEQRIALIAEPITRLIAAPEDRVLGIERRAQVATTAGHDPLQGTTKAVVEDGLIHRSTHAQGSRTLNDVVAITSVTVDRIVDARTGLIRSMVQTNVTQTDRAGRLTVTVSNILTTVR